jgi:plastocyanin
MRFFVLLVVALALLAAGCGGGDGEGEGDDVATGDAAAQTIQVSATDFQFDPADLTADAGEISFELTNDGEAPHALEIEGNGVEEASDTIDPGASTTLTVELEDGTYEIYCPVGDHADRGMVGTLTVGAGGGAGGATTGHDDETETGGGDTGETDTGDDDEEDGLGY